jgi:hypothetical protein
LQTAQNTLDPILAQDAISYLQRTGMRELQQILGGRNLSESNSEDSKPMRLTDSKDIIDGDNLVDSKPDQ